MALTAMDSDVIPSQAWGGISRLLFVDAPAIYSVDPEELQLDAVSGRVFVEGADEQSLGKPPVTASGGNLKGRLCSDRWMLAGAWQYLAWVRESQEFAVVGLECVPGPDLAAAVWALKVPVRSSGNDGPLHIAAGECSAGDGDDASDAGSDVADDERVGDEDVQGSSHAQVRGRS